MGTSGRVALAVVLATSLCVAQGYPPIPAAVFERKLVVSPLEFSLQRAAVTYLIAYYQQARDTVLPVFVRHTIWIRIPEDSLQILYFTVDSIRGRGANREVKVTRWQKSEDSTAWWAVNGETMDSVRTLDSTARRGRWLKRSYEIETSWGIGYSVDLWGMRLQHHQLALSLDKVTGDPTKNWGYDQQARLRFRLTEAIPDSVLVMAGLKDTTAKE